MEKQYIHQEKEGNVIWLEALKRIEEKLDEKFAKLDEELNELEIEESMLRIRKRFINECNCYLEDNDYFNDAMVGKTEEVWNKYDELTENVKHKISKIKIEVADINTMKDQIERLKK